MPGQKQAIFRFYAELNDFLPRAWRQTDIPYQFWGHPAVKDAIEALGVPHPEVDLILVNNQSVNFDYRLRQGDRVAVYPVFELLNIAPVTRLRPRPLRKIRFVLDANLGKLARNLRMLGFDALYRNNFQDVEVIEIALQEQRIILTRDVELLKNGKVTHGYWVRHTDAQKQVEEVLQKFDLFDQIRPFTRCLVCNGLLLPVEKEDIEDQLPPRVRQSFETFYRCAACGKVYWRGSHFERMEKMVEHWRNQKR